MNTSYLRLHKRLVVTALIVVALIIAAVVAFLMLRQPNKEDYAAASGTQLNVIASTRKNLAPAVNKYLASYKAAYNESQSIEAATKKAHSDFDAFIKAEETARTSIVTLNKSRAANDGETKTAIRQLTDDYAAEISYFSGLVKSYPEYTALFSSDQKCSGVFVGKTDSLADRQKKLDAAAKKCYAAINTLKGSTNITYIDYAKKIERRVKQLQADGKETAQAEVNLKKYEVQIADFQKQFADATARNASEAELNKLAADIKSVTAQINENKAQFEFAGKRYIGNVEEMPKLFQNVYGTDVPAKLKSFNELYQYRSAVLKLVLQDKQNI